MCIYFCFAFFVVRLSLHSFHLFAHSHQGCFVSRALRKLHDDKAIDVRRSDFGTIGHYPNMMVSSHGNIFRVTDSLCGEFTGHRWIIHRSSVNSPHNGQWREALIFSLICARINGLSKQSWGCWFETPSRSLWRHCSDHQNSPTCNVSLFLVWLFIGCNCLISGKFRIYA